MAQALRVNHNGKTPPMGDELKMMIYKKRILNQKRYKKAIKG